LEESNHQPASAPDSSHCGLIPVLKESDSQAVHVQDSSQRDSVSRMEDSDCQHVPDSSQGFTSQDLVPLLDYSQGFDTNFEEISIDLDQDWFFNEGSALSGQIDKGKKRKLSPTSAQIKAKKSRKWQKYGQRLVTGKEAVGMDLIRCYYRCKVFM